MLLLVLLLVLLLLLVLVLLVAAGSTVPPSRVHCAAAAESGRGQRLSPWLKRADDHDVFVTNHSGAVRVPVACFIPTPVAASIGVSADLTPASSPMLAGADTPPR